MEQLSEYLDICKARRTTVYGIILLLTQDLLAILIVIAQSSVEEENIAVAMTISQTILLRRILEDIGEPQSEATEIYCDNKSTIAITKNLSWQD